MFSICENCGTKYTETSIKELVEVKRSALQNIIKKTKYVNMENKIDKIAIVIGIVIGCVFGSMMSYSMFKDYEKCELLVEENKMLRDMLYEEQNPY
jgi:hypothetical protein